MCWRKMTSQNILIIAEAGVNHNGSIDNAIKLIKMAKNIGADIIKFQTYKTENISLPSARKAQYQYNNDKDNETQYSMLKRLELDYKDFKLLFDISKKYNIEFLSTAFDLESLHFLYKLGQRRFKIPSGEINNLPYLREIGKFGKEIILSTGMSYLKEIKKAINILIKNGTPKNKITVLHCNTEYPTPYENVNLLAMRTIKEKLNIKIGYSDHTTGIEIPIAAATMGAHIIEKHLTINSKQKGPDHKSSLEPKEFKLMISSIRNIEKAMGDRNKKPTLGEIKNMTIVRKSIVAKKDIKKGEIFTIKNITLKRPGTGISPIKWDKFIGKRAKRNFVKNSFIK